MEESSTTTLLLGKALVGVGIAVGIILTLVPLQGPDWPPVVLGAAIAAWGLVAWRMALQQVRGATPILAAGIAFTAWSYFLLAPYLGVQVTGITLLLPILACLPILGPVGVALIGAGSIVVNVFGHVVQPTNVAAPPLQLASLTAATILGLVVTVLHRRHVHEVATARAHERELSVLHDLEEQRADFLRRFINAVSHEIATPLTPLVLDISGETPTDQTLARMRRNVERLHHIAHGLEDVALVEERTPDPMAYHDLQVLVPPVAEVEGWRVRGEGHAWADPVLVEAILQEIAENQQRYAPGAQVDVHLRNGGIKVVQMPAGLPAGTRLGRPFTRHHPGSRGGLGLYAVARRLERAGGTIVVEADGSLVHDIRFPPAPAAAAPKAS